jgi:plasmid stability protein
MTPLATLHIRNVPESVYEALKRRADRNGRSLNMEVVEALEESVADDRRTQSVLRRLRDFRTRYALPDDAPKPEEVIREMRDAPPRGL